MSTRTSAAPELEPETGLVWRRMHPVTPVVRGWTVIVVLLFIVLQNSAESLQGLGDTVDLARGVGLLWILGGLAVVLAVVSLYCWVAWRFTRYAIGTDAVHLRKGILFRQQKQARLDRLQAVDIVQPLLARAFSLAELRLEVAGGAGSGVAIGFLRRAEADALRAELLARAAGVDVAEGEAAPVAPERVLYEVPFATTAGSVVRSFVTPVLVLLVAGVVIAVAVTSSAAPIFTLLPALLGFGGYVFQRLVSEANFVGAVSPDGIRSRSGLLETRSQTIPPGRVQAIRMRQPLLWRRKDWWRVDVTVAGYTIGGETKEVSTLLLPVGPRETAFDALWLVLPDLGVADPLALLAAGLDGSGADGGFTTSPRAARWLDPLTWRRNGYAVAGRCLVIRRGRLTRSLTLVPHERTQSLALQQGPWQRRLGLASVALHVTLGPVQAQVHHLGAADAARLLDEQDDRARSARRAEGPEQWMRRVAPELAEQVEATDDASGVPVQAPPVPVPPVPVPPVLGAEAPAAAPTQPAPEHPTHDDTRRLDGEPSA
ncbi:PH domain-containing protein [Sanguibacter sp. HDW7]|uniref:PH domain-containing protein n=1 Tax=Sanguibacter sp. HDW7 TaxID=2714931 RepID=UPI001F0F4E9D|nr:PH domain-containing protein [Sanguibacter sp. HDW7]